jgi:hypothetical protein
MTLHLFLLIGGFGVLLVLFARFILLNLARSVQRAHGYSNQFVTEVAVALPIALFVIFLVVSIGWLSK